jgi:hypothetical protein
MLPQASQMHSNHALPSVTSWCRKETPHTPHVPSRRPLSLMWRMGMARRRKCAPAYSACCSGSAQSCGSLAMRLACWKGCSTRWVAYKTNLACKHARCHSTPLLSCGLHAQHLMVLFCTQVLQRVLAEALQEPQSAGNSAPEPLTSLSIQKVRRHMPEHLNHAQHC